MVKVKICGITNLKDAQMAANLGADALGFVFAESPRRANPKDVQTIVARLGPFVTTVGVFVNQKADRILEIAALCRLDAIQLHGEESPDVCRRLSPYKLIKTFRMDEIFSTREPKKYTVDAYLFETADQIHGGTGRTWQWEKLPVKKISRPFIVSGGLTHSNVKHAIRILNPYAVDVSSGVESSKPGHKDPSLMERFIANAKTS